MTTKHEAIVKRRWWSGEYVVTCKNCKGKRVLASSQFNEAMVTALFHNSTGRW